MRFNLPIILTWFRILAVPLLVAVFYLPGPWAGKQEINLCATIIFTIAAFTDWADGWLARRNNQVSSFGAFLDPVADKLMVAAVLLILLDLERISVLVAIIIMGREIAISALREWMAQIGAATNVAVSLLGKLKTVSQMVAIPLLLFHQPLWGLDVHALGTVLIWMAALLTLWSMFFYLHKAWPEIKQRQHVSR